MNKRTYSTVSVALLAVALAAGNAIAQKRTEKYPTKPIRLIVPMAPGGGSDLVARALAQRLTEVFGQAVITDNRAGGGGTIGNEIAVNAAPDGYTIGLTSASYATNAALFKLPYDPVGDITPISLIGETGWMLSLHPSVPAKSTRELIALAKAGPGVLNYASTGTGGVTHLVTELFNLMAGIRMTHIPYKGGGPALNDLLGGHVQVFFGGIPPMVALNVKGRVRGIALTTTRRIDALPDIPTLGEIIPGYEATLWWGLFGPKGLPEHIVARWNAEVSRVLTTPAMHERLVAQGIDPAGGPPERFFDVLRRDVPKWIKVVKEANIKVIQ